MDNTSLFQWIERLAGLARAARRGPGAQLQPVHLRVLEYLARCNRYSDTPAAVGHYLGTTKGTVSQSLKILEREAYVRKRADAADGRVVHLTLTAKARRLLQQLHDDPWESAAEQALNEAERIELRRLLTQLLRGAQAAAGFRTFGQCATCRHLRGDPATGLQCGLTQETLSQADTAKICHEHEFPKQA